MKNLKIDYWTCNDGDKKEVHLYKKGETTSYIFGFSPIFFRKKDIKKIIKMIKKK